MTQVTKVLGNLVDGIPLNRLFSSCFPARLTMVQKKQTKAWAIEQLEVAILIKEMMSDDGE